MPRQRLGKGQPGGTGFERWPGNDRALAKRQAGVADEQRFVGTALEAESLAGRAPAERTVERVIMWIERFEAQVAMFAGKMLGKVLDLPLGLVAVGVNVSDVHDAATQIERLLDCLGDPRPRAGLH